MQEILIALYLVTSGLSILYLVLNLKYAKYGIIVLIVLIIFFLFEGFQLASRSIALTFFLLLLCIGYITVSIIKELGFLAKYVGSKEVLFTSLKALLLSWPLILAIIFSLWLVNLRNTHIEKHIYNTAQKEAIYACRPNEEKLFCKNSTLKNDMISTSNHVFAAMEGDISSRVDIELAKVETTSYASTAQILETFFTGSDPIVLSSTSGLFPPPKYRRRYWIYKPGQNIKHKIFTAINSGYAKARRNFENDFREKLAEVDGGVSAKADFIRERTDSFVEDELSIYNTNTNDTIRTIFFTITIVTFFVHLFILFGFIKSFLFIAARLLYDEKYGDKLLGSWKSSDSTELVRKKITSVDITEKTDGKTQFSQSTLYDSWYACFDRNVRYNRHGKPKFPNLLQLVFRRLVTGKYLTKYYDKDEEEFGGYASHESRFVRVELDEGHEVFFRIKNLMAFTQGIEFRNKFDFKMASMLKLRLLFSVARGPGAIILKAHGGSLTILPDGEDAKLAPYDILAFDTSGTFSLNSSHALLAVYLHGYTLIPDENTFVIRHVPRSISRPISSLRKILFFLSPV